MCHPATTNTHCSACAHIVKDTAADDLYCSIPHPPVGTHTTTHNHQEPQPARDHSTSACICPTSTRYRCPTRPPHHPCWSACRACRGPPAHPLPGATCTPLAGGHLHTPRRSSLAGFLGAVIEHLLKDHPEGGLLGGAPGDLEVLAQLLEQGLDSLQHKGSSMSVNSEGICSASLEEAC
jgi:hypothetical protein